MNVDALSINTYAGSLLLGMKAAGIKIRGSYEDCAWGVEATHLNFPKVKFVDNAPWPDDDLSRTVVVAHPPCSAFSNQNNAKHTQGIDTPAFECHRKVMEYALGNGCAGLTIESVPGVMKAAATYAHYAKNFKYTHYFIYLNSASFGVPQWRPRIWVVFLRDQGRLVLNHTPVYRTVSDILQPPDEVEPHHYNTRLIEYFQKKFVRAGFDFDDYLRYENIGHFVPTVAEFAGCEKSREAVDRLTGTKGLYGVSLPRKLDPEWFSTVILGSAFLFVHGRPVTRIEYQRIMGFPDNWRWPASMENKFTLYLSKGVCPPVARWVVEQLAANATGEARLGDRTRVGAPGDLIDIRPNREQAIEGIRLAHQLPLPLPVRA